MKIDITLGEALAKASPALRQKMQHTADLIRKAEALSLKYDPEKGFYVGVSFGKDSQALFHMMQLSGVKFHAYFSPTSVDPPEVLRFGRRYYPEVEFGKIDKSIYTVFKEMKVLPSMRIRWCCNRFKERGGEGKVVCTGVRKAESVKRSKRNEIEVSGRKFSGHIDEFEDWQQKKIRKLMKNLNQDQFSEVKETEVRCINGKDKILLSPIIEWTENDVWEFLNKVVEVPHCELYDQGWTRIGCICCPMASIKNTHRDIKRWPYVKEKWIRAIMDVRKESLLGNYTIEEVESGVANWGGAISLSKVLPPRQVYTGSSQSTDCTPERQSDEIFPSWVQQYTRMGTAQRRFAQSVQQLQDRILEGSSNRGGKTPQRSVDGKFLGGDNGESSAVVAEYNEEQERQIAEAIFDWWISKESFATWYAKTYLQQKIDFDEYGKEN